MSNKLRWTKFFWADWSDDPALALCSHMSQSIWMRLLCIMAQGEPYGHCTINGKPATIEQLARLIRPRVKPSSMARYVDELLRNGVCQQLDDRTLISRRMVSDWMLSELRSGAANVRWKAAGKADHSTHLHMQTDNFAMLEGEAEGEANAEPSHPNPPLRSRGGKGFSHEELLAAVRQGAAETAAATQGGMHGADKPRHVDDPTGRGSATKITQANGHRLGPNAAIPHRRARSRLH